MNFPVYVLEGGLKLKMPAFLLRGPPGVGKTELTRLIAEFLGAEYVFYQCTLNTSEDDLLYRYIPNEKTKSGIKVLPSVLPQALELSKREKVVVVLDEFDKTRPSADALLLDFLQNTRVSARFESEREITGNPENIVVFITSNDMREFSEPLLRRVIQLRLDPLPSKEVARLLKGEGFGDELISLLTQIYTDTHGAGLRKPATIQELKQLGHIIQQNPHADLDTLVQSLIIKYDEDLETYRNYLLLKKNDSNEITAQQDYFISQHYTYVAHEQKKEQANDGQNSDKPAPAVAQILELLKTKQPDVQIQPEKGTEQETVYLKAKDEEREAYTEIIKRFRPEPTDDPTAFGKFELKLDNDVPYVITKTPLTFGELKANVEGEGYAKVKPVFSQEYLMTKLVEIADKIKYYTKDVVAIEMKTASTLILIKYSAPAQEMEIYFKGKSNAAHEEIEKLLITSPDYEGAFSYCDDMKRAINWISTKIERLKKVIIPSTPILVQKDTDTVRRINLKVSLDRITLTLSGDNCLNIFGEVKTFEELVEKVESIAKSMADQQ